MPKKIAHSTLYQLIEAGHMARTALLQPLQAFGLNPGDDAVILAMKNKQITTDHQLCDLVGLTPRGLQPRLDRLQALSFIQRVSHGKHFSPATKLTKSGRKIRKKLIAHWGELENSLMDDLSHKDKKQLRHIMRRFTDLLSL